MQVADINIKKESPVGHGKIICFSISCGSQDDFGNGKSCVWVYVLDSGEDVLLEFSRYFGDPSIWKVRHSHHIWMEMKCWTTLLVNMILRSNSAGIHFMFNFRSLCLKCKLSLLINVLLRVYEQLKATLLVNSVIIRMSLIIDNFGIFIQYFYSRCKLYWLTSVLFCVCPL